MSLFATSCARTEIVYKDRLCEVINFDKILQKDLDVMPNEILREILLLKNICKKYAEIQ